MCKSKTESDGKRKHIIVGTVAKHDVGRWRRGTGSGKGIGDRKRDRESDDEDKVACVDSSHENIETLSNPKRSLDMDVIETLSNPKRSLDMDVSVIKSVGSGGQAQDNNVQHRRPNAHKSPTTLITPGSDHPGVGSA